MKLLFRALALFGLVALAPAQPSRAALLELITATDPAASFTTSYSVITSMNAGPGSEAVVLPGSSLGSGNTLHLELQLDPGGETPFTFGTGFDPTWPSTSPELIIFDALSTPLLTANLTHITVTGQSLVPGTAGLAQTSVTLGAVDLSTHLVLTGGTQAANFGGIGALGSLSVFLNAPSVDWTFGSVFDQDFTAQMNVQLQFHTVPEPRTALLIGLSLAGLLAWQRRSGISRRRDG